MQAPGLDQGPPSSQTSPDNRHIAEMQQLIMDEQQAYLGAPVTVPMKHYPPAECTHAQVVANKHLFQSTLERLLEFMEIRLKVGARARGSGHL